jgi:hypothetical protein
LEKEKLLTTLRIEESTNLKKEKLLTTMRIEESTMGMEENNSCRL